MTQKETIIQLWIEKNVAKIKYEFDCGGDNMGETNLIILDETDKAIECNEIEDYFENKIYDNVDFYVNSDGHYMGENGNVIVILNEDKTDFEYTKYSTEEYEELELFNVFVELTEEEIDYINLYVRNINNDGWDSEVNYNYKTDFIKLDRHEELEKSITKKISDFWADYEPDVTGELKDDGNQSWNTNDEDEDETIVTDGTKLKVSLHYWSNIYKDGND